MEDNEQEEPRQIIRLPKRPRQKKAVPGLAVFIIVIALAVLLSAGQALGTPPGPRPEGAAGSAEPLSRLLRILGSRGAPRGAAPRPGTPYVARLFITGTIEAENQRYNQQWLLDTIGSLEEDSNNRGIILFINSPGGGVYEADEVYLRLLEYKKQKPLYAYMGPVAASGGYYIACAADYIMANRNTLTGSIGVIAGQFLDLTGLMERYGVASETIHAGRNKNMGNINEPLTEEQRSIMQSVADECYAQFTSIVADSRRMAVETVEELADGRIYTARQAQEHGLIDAVGTWDDMEEAFGRLAEDAGGYPVEDVYYEREDTLYRYLMGAAKSLAAPQAGAASALPQAVEGALRPQVPFPAYYYESGRQY